MLNTYRLVVGDWSHDGHNQSEEYIFTTSSDRKAIIKAYKKAERLAGVGLTRLAKKEILGDYEDSTIEAEDVQKLKDIGLKFEHVENIENDDGSLSCGPDDVFYIFMEMVATQLPGFEYQKAELPEPINGWWSDFNEGIGYGVFN